MGGIESLCYLQLNQYAIGNEQICCVATNDNVAIVHSDHFLLLDLEAGQPQLVRQCILVNFLQESNPKSIRHSERATVDGVRDFIQSALIGVRWRLHCS